VAGRTGRTALLSQQAERRRSRGRCGPAPGSTRCPPEAHVVVPGRRRCLSGDCHKKSLCIGVDKRGDLAGVHVEPVKGRPFLKAR
jgi:hypothetical protein